MEEITHSLGIDWGLVVTQIVGFLLALWILKAFAWKPLLKVLDERRKRILMEMREAEESRIEAGKVLEEYRARLRNIDAEARAKIQEAISEGNRIAAEIRESARRESRSILAKSRQELARDVAKAKAQLRDDMASMAIRGAEKIISANLDEATHRRLLNDFLKEVGEGQ